MATFYKKIGNYKDVVCVTLSEICKHSGKSAKTLRSWEKKGWLPQANFRTADVVESSGKKRKGYRLYTQDTAMAMAALIKKVKTGVKIDTETIRQLHLLQKEELKKYFDAT